MQIFILKIINMVPATVYAGALAFTLLSLSLSLWSLDRAKDNLAIVRASLVTCAAVNDTNKKTINRFTVINNKCVADREADETRHTATVATWVMERELLEALANEERTIETIEVYREPSCAELAKININDICPGLADSLRERSAGNN